MQVGAFAIGLVQFEEESYFQRILVAVGFELPLLQSFEDITLESGCAITVLSSFTDPLLPIDMRVVVLPMMRLSFAARGYAGATNLSTAGLSASTRVGPWEWRTRVPMRQMTAIRTGCA